MTREEASNILDDYDVNFAGHTAEEIAEAFEVAFRALEQEHCGDAISRQEVIDEIYESRKNFNNEFDQGFFADKIKALSSVNPTKTGHWIPVSERLPEKYTYTLWCASSRYVRSDYFNGEFWEDAKKLGYEVIAWMPLPKPYEPQESEE